MIRSMTGFGDASEQVDGIHYSLELRSLNNRYFKATIRLPEPVAGLEAELEAALRKKLHRGSITLNASMAHGDTHTTHRINEAALTAYLRQLQNIQQQMSNHGQSPMLDLATLLALPGVMELSDSGELLRKTRPVFLKLLDRAIEKLLVMRVTEGQTLADDLRKQAAMIHSKLVEVSTRAPRVVEEYHQRLRSRVEELLRRSELAVNQVDLVREVAVFAERADITEELSRLAAHLAQMEAALATAEGEPAGRMLEFLGQEMLREANTIGSKSNDATIARDVVDIKTAIDRIKEQAANIE